MRTAEFIQRCVDAGMPLEIALAAAKAFDAEVQIVIEQVLDTRRAKDRDRKAKSRAERSRMSAEVTDVRGSHVTSRDNRDEEPASRVVYTSLPSEELKITPYSPSESLPPKSKSKGHRLPDDWLPDPAELGCGLPPDVWAGELDKFRDYWRAVPGAKGLKLDWDATWRNWIRRTAEDHARSPRKALGPDAQPSAKQVARHANYERAFAGAQAAARSRNVG